MSGNICETEGLTDIENRLVLTKGEAGLVEGRTGSLRYKLLFVAWTNIKVLLYRTRNYIQYPIIYRNSKEYEKGCLNVYLYIYVTESLCYTEKLTQHCKSTILQ